MKVIFNIGGRKLVLSQETMSEVLNLLHNSEVLVEKYVGSGKGNSGSDLCYNTTLGKLSVFESFALEMIPEPAYEAIRMFSLASEKQEK